ncbi:MAG: hypothetical protein AAFX06_05730 [Planctomycetota bacterium]
MKKTLWLVMLGVVLTSTGCIRPYDTPEYHEIGSSHTAFLVPLEGNTEKQVSFDSEEFLSGNMVATKRVRIPHTWIQTGRWPSDGEWVGSMRLITIDRAPVTRQWNADSNSGTSAKDEAIWIESRDSVGFSTGITCTCRIPDDKTAVKFLYNYPAATSTQSSNADQQLIDSGKGLAAVMDSEIRAQVQSRMSEFAALYNMDELREKKPEMLAYVRFGHLPSEVQPNGWDKLKQSGVVEFFEERGIEITTLGQFGGFTYENVKIQDAIDQVFQAQQDEEVAKAEAEAQRARNEAVKLEAEGKAEAAKLAAQGQADAIQLVADAKAYEIEKAQENWEQYLALKQLEIEETRLEKWDGNYPQSYVGGDLPGLGPMMITHSK